jgi:hypothetical protein
MAQAKTDNSTTSRRRFLTVAAAASAVSAGALAAAAMPPAALAASQDDSALVKLEEQIFEQYQGATAYDAEILRLSKIWTTESCRLYKEALSREVQTGTYLTDRERWDLVGETPESKEHSRLCRLQDPFLARMDALIKQMWATPAHTAEGRRAKAAVLIGCIMGPDWQQVDKETDYPEKMARSLLLELIGGEPGEALRDQFA